MTSTVMNLESIIWKSPDWIYMSTSVRLISKKLPIFHEIFTYMSCEMCVKLSTVFMFKLRLIVTLVLYKAIDIGKWKSNLTRIWRGNGQDLTRMILDKLKSNYIIKNSKEMIGLMSIASTYALLSWQSKISSHNSVPD